MHTTFSVGNCKQVARSIYRAILPVHQVHSCCPFVVSRSLCLPFPSSQASTVSCLVRHQKLPLSCLCSTLTFLTNSPPELDLHVAQAVIKKQLSKIGNNRPTGNGDELCGSNFRTCAYKCSQHSSKFHIIQRGALSHVSIDIQASKFQINCTITKEICLTLHSHLVCSRKLRIYVVSDRVRAQRTHKQLAYRTWQTSRTVGDFLQGRKRQRTRRGRKEEGKGAGRKN